MKSSTWLSLLIIFIILIFMVPTNIKVFFGLCAYLCLIPLCSKKEKKKTKYRGAKGRKKKKKSGPIIYKIELPYEQTD